MIKVILVGILWMTILQLVDVGWGCLNKNKVYVLFDRLPVTLLRCVISMFSLHWRICYMYVFVHCSQRRRRTYLMMLLALSLEEFTCRRWILVSCRHGRWKDSSANRGRLRIQNSQDSQGQQLMICLFLRNAGLQTMWRLTSLLCKYWLILRIIQCFHTLFLFSVRGYLVSLFRNMIYPYIIKFVHF